MRGLTYIVILAIVAGAGWVGGTLYPAPSTIVAYVNPGAVAERAQRDLEGLGNAGNQNWDQIPQGFKDQFVRFAQQAGAVVKTEHVVDEATKDAELPSAPAISTPPSVGTSSHGAFEALISLCPKMTIDHAPAADAQGRIANFASLITVNGDAIAVDPIRDACLSSGFGVRNGKLHKGIDFYNANGGPILAAGDGVILEMKYRDDYGNMILIDHGHGVYTRYAHLSSFQTGLNVGSHVHAADQIGLMGNTAGYPVPLHLHYELLLGDYKNPKASFGLTPHSQFEYLPAAG